MKNFLITLLIVSCCFVGMSCTNNTLPKKSVSISEDTGFYEARVRYANPLTGSSSVLPATVYIKNGKIRSIIVDNDTVSKY